jgi:hypothetical protein
MDINSKKSLLAQSPLQLFHFRILSGPRQFKRALDRVHFAFNPKSTSLRMASTHRIFALSIGDDIGFGLINGYLVHRNFTLRILSSCGRRVIAGRRCQ